jgi:hypothetical protein
MASVAGTVAALRTIPIPDLRSSLSSSAVEFEQTDPAGYAEQKVRIDMDLEILAVLDETRERLGVVIRKYAPPEAAEVEA